MENHINVKMITKLVLLKTDKLVICNWRNNKQYDHKNTRPEVLFIIEFLLDWKDKF